MEQVARDYSKAVGILLPNSESAKAYKERGYQFIGVSSHEELLNQADRSVVRALKWGDDGPVGGLLRQQTMFAVVLFLLLKYCFYFRLLFSG